MTVTRREFVAGATIGATAMVGARLDRDGGPPDAPAVESPAPRGREVAEVGEDRTAGRPEPPTAEPEAQEIAAFYRSRRNWGRWGSDDQAGAVNLITPEKRLEALALARNGRALSLSRPFRPEQHFMRVARREGGAGGATDYYGSLYHGQTVTHIDALCHIWDDQGMWNGRDPDREIDTAGAGARFGDVAAFSPGLVTRGVLLDVPRHRGEPHVTMERPVRGAELEEIARAQGVEVRPGDALLVHSGREAYVRAGNTYAGGARPGLHGSCAMFVRDHDVALLGWDMMDAQDAGPLPALRPMHAVLHYFGVPLLDNALLEPLARACGEERRYEFLFLALPLVVPGGTGSPLNPVAMF